ncbi:MAG: hypothetical protein M3243_06025, partial [Thermoproteota archaeon]|nr:hypothetical protein [Thermoproteota archaeon]
KTHTRSGGVCYQHFLGGYYSDSCSSSTFVMHYIIRTEFLLTIGAGMITLFIAMGFGYKLSKKFVKVLSGNNR